MIEIPYLKMQNLKEYFQLNFNKGFYDYYHEYFKGEYQIEIEDLESFLYDLHSDILIFWNNYLEMPHETNNYFLNKIESSNDENAIVNSLHYQMLMILLTQILDETYVDRNGKTHQEDNNVFINNFWTFKFSIRENIYAKAEKLLKEMKGEDYDLVTDFFDVLIGYTAPDETHMNVNEINNIKRYYKTITSQSEIKKPITNENKNKPIILLGKQINLLERFEILNKLVGIETKIRTLKISEAEKHELLSVILGCNIDNAKKIMNGKYDAKIKEDFLETYYKTLKL